MMQSKLTTLIHHFIPVDYLTDLSADIVELSFIEQQTAITVSITLPYAAGSLAEQIKPYLTEHFPEHSFEVKIDCRLCQAPIFKQIRNIILVASGKGGVGKSTTAVNLAVALKQEGAQVGLLDADIYGPSIPLMFGMQGQRPTSADGKIMEPLQGFGVKVNSIGFLIDPQDAAVWRGPMASSALTQLIGETHWGELDYLVIDMPPGTGDIQLTISQKFPCTGAVIVTTPQNIALADAQKGIAMFAKVNIPVLGIVENMSYFQCSHCGSTEHIFGEDGAVTMAKAHNSTLLGQIPLQKQHRENGDLGQPTVLTDSPLAPMYRNIARKLAKNIFDSQRDNTAMSGPEISFIDD